MVHELKILPKYFDKVLSGEKTFEIRIDDRNYTLGDTLVLNEFFEQRYTGKKIAVEVLYVLRHEDFPEGIPEGYVVLSIKKAMEHGNSKRQSERRR